METGGECPPDENKLLRELLARALAGDLSAAERTVAQQIVQSNSASPSSSAGSSAGPNVICAGNINHSGAQELEDMEDSDSDDQDDDVDHTPDTTFGQVAAEVEAEETCRDPSHVLCQQVRFPPGWEEKYDLNLLNKINFLMNCGSQHHELCKTKWMDTDDITVDTACQQGKSGAKIRGCWISYYFFGMGSAIWLHNDKNAYVQMHNAIEQFNYEVDGIIDRFRPGMDATAKMAYHLKDYAVDDCRGGYLPNDIKDFPGAVVLLRCTLPSNILTFVKGALPFIIQKYGAPTDGSRKLNFACFFDENQENIQNASKDKAKKESLLFAQSFNASLERAYKVTFPPERIAQDLRAWLPQAPGFKNIFKLVCDVSATSISKYLTNDKPTIVLTLDLPADFYGLRGCDPRLPPERTIETVAIDDSIDDSDKPLLERHDIVPVLAQRMGSQAAERGLIWTPPSGGNISLCDLARDVCSIFLHHERPMLCLCYYGGCAHTPGMGPSIYVNRAAEAILDALVDADHSMFRTRDQLSEEVRMLPGNHPLTSGKTIQCDGGEYIFVTKSIATDGEFSQDRATGVRYMRVPRGGVWKISRLLDLINQACTLSGIDVDRLFLLTIGNTLIRASVSLKTRDHQLALTFQMLLLTRRALLGKDYQQLTQIAGRLHGRRKAGEAAPIFYAPRYVLEKMANALKFAARSRQAMKAANGLSMTPLRVIEQTSFPGFSNMPDLPCSKRVYTAEHDEAIRRNSTPGDFHYVPEEVANAAREAMAQSRATQRRRFRDEFELEHALAAHREGLVTSMRTTVRTEIQSGPLRGLLRDMLKACYRASVGFGPPMYHDFNDILPLLRLSPNDRQALQVRDLLVLLARRAEQRDEWIRKPQGGNPRFLPLIHIRAPRSGPIMIKVLTDIPDNVFDQ